MRTLYEGALLVQSFQTSFPSPDFAGPASVRPQTGPMTTDGRIHGDANTFRSLLKTGFVSLWRGRSGPRLFNRLLGASK